MGQTGQQAANDFSSAVTTNPQTGLQVSGNQQSQTPNWVGTVNPNKEDYLGLGNFQSNMF